MKTCKIRHIPAHKALSVTYKGIMNTEDSRRLASDMLAEGDRLGVRRFLVDNRDMTPESTTEDLYDFPKTLRGIGFTPLHRVAVLPPKSYTGREEIRFIETASFNRHLSMRFFEGADEALRWLDQEKA